MELLKELNPPVGVLFEDEHINTLSRGVDAILALLSSVAQGESENKSEAMLWSYRNRFENGIALCPTWALLGYTTDEFGNMQIVPEEAEIVEYIYKRYLEGCSGTRIAIELTEAGIPTVKGKEIWSATSVYSILRNEKYCGDVVNQKTYTKDFKSHKKLKNRGKKRKYIIRDHHPAIVSRKDWDKVQAMLASPHRSRRAAATKQHIDRVRMTLIKRGNFKGYIVFDPTWSHKDLSTVMEKMGIAQTEKGANYHAEEL